ncbi:MAG: Ig-like domain-containing protein [Actinomycetota bacterium]|nr:Ig-like domain-containing protein [Actinomycetota bacterium]
MTGSASAAVITGSGSDPRDAKPNVSTGRYDPDLASTNVTYDDMLGRITVQWTLHEALPSTGSGYVYFSLGLGTASDSCKGDGSDPFLSLSGSASIYGDRYANLSFGPAAPVRGDFSGALATNDLRTFTATFSNAALARYPLRCATGGRMGSDYFDDEQERFCLGGSGCFTPPPPPDGPDRTPPRVSWRTPRTGDVVSGILSASRRNCYVDATDASGIQRTENYVDGVLNDVQVNPPWECEIDTRRLADGPHTLRVRAFDRAGNVAEATAFITVRNQSAPPVQPARAVLRLGSRRAVTALRNRFVPVTVRCTAACVGTLRLRTARGTTVARRSFRLRRAGATQLRVRLTSRGARLLRRSGRLRLRATATARLAGGTSVTTRATYTVRARPR